MRGGWFLLVLLASTVGIGSAEARRRAPAAECPFSLPTGQPLPRQADVTKNGQVSPRPFPDAQTQPIGSLKPGDKVTVTAECGVWLKIETDGIGGWAHVIIMPAEHLLVEAAATKAYVAQGIPNPCERYLPTGEPLPRQALVPKDAPLYLMPNPGYREGPFVMLHGGTQGTVLKECGRKLRVRGENGIEGWADVVSLEKEAELQTLATKRPLASAEECAVRYDDPNVVQRCREEFTSNAAHEAEMKASAYLTGEEIEPFVAGKTFVIVEPGETLASANDPSYNHFAANGQYYLKTGVGGAGTNYRGRWRVESSALCMPQAFQPCYRLLRTPSGQVKWMAMFRGALTEHDAIEDPASTARIIAEIERYYPDQPAELAPEESAGPGMSAPAMGD